MTKDPTLPKLPKGYKVVEDDYELPPLPSGFKVVDDSEVKKDSRSGSGNGLSSSIGGLNAFPNSQAKPLAPTVLSPKNQAEYVKKQAKEKEVLTNQLDNAQNAFRTVQDIDTVEAVDVYKNKDQPFNTVKEPEKDPSFLQSVANTGSNIVTGLKQFIPNTAIAVTDGLTQVLGKDLGGDVYAQLTRGGNVDMQRSEAYQALADLEPQFKHTRGLIESGQKFDVPGLAAATIDAVGSLVRTAVTSIPTAGFGLYSDMVGSSVANYNKQKAKSLGVTVDELYGKGENDYFVPATIGAVGAQMEKIGLKGVQSAINKQLTGSATKKMALLFNDVNKEGLTEWLQTGLEKGNTALGSGKDAVSAGEEAVSEMFSKKGLEAYLMGVVGSGGAAGLGRIAKGITNPKNKAKVEEDVATINRFTEEIVNPDASPATKAFVEKQIRSKVADVASTIDEDAESVEKFGAEQKQVIQDLQGQIAQAEEVTRDPALTPETKVLAEEEVKTLNKELETALKEKPKLTDKDAVIEEESDLQINEKKKLQRVIDEGGSKKQLLQSYGINTNYGEWSQEDIDYNYQQIVDEYGLKTKEEESKEVIEVPTEVVEEQVVETPNEIVESETLIEEPNAIQEPSTTESLLRTEQPEMGLQGVGQGVQQVTETPNETVTEEVQVSEKEKRTVDTVEKDQKQVLASYHDALKEAGIYESAQRGTANPSVLEKIKEKFKPQFDALQQEREALDPTKKQLTDEEKVDFAKSEIGKGAINWDGDRFSPRPDLNMSWADIRKGQKDLEAGKMTVPAKKLIDAIDKARKAGGYKFTQGSGSAFVDMFVPMSEVSATQLTSEEIKDITDNEATLAKEYDEWFKGLTEEQKNEELNFTEDEDTNTSRESKEDVSDKESPKATAESKTEKESARPVEKAGDPLRALADKIEKGKINKLGGFRASIGFDAVWDGSLTVVAQSLRTGAKLADAIEAGLKHIRKTDWYKNLTDKKDFESKYKAHLREEYESGTTTLRNADVEQKREDYGFDEPLPKTKVSNEETLNKAKQAIENDSQIAYDVIDKAINKEPLDATEMAILAQFQGAKEAELLEANKKIEQAKDSSVLAFNNAVEARGKVIDDLIMAYDASELSGATAGRALQARKIKVLQDYSLARMLIRKRKANDNQNLTNEQINEVTERYNALVEAEKKLKDKLAKLEEENSKLKLKEFTPKIRVEANREARENRRTQTKETLKNERESIFEEMRKVIKKSRGEVSMNPIPVEMVPLVGRLAKNYFVDGMTSIEAIVDKIHGDLVDIVEGVTKRDVRDAISGYNRDTRPTKDDLQKDIQDLKTQAKLISQIEDAENGVKKAKTEVKRKEASDEVEMLRARLKDLTKGETALEGLKTRIKKQIADTQKKLDNNDFSKKVSETIELDDEARKLQDAYRKIKYEFDVALAKDELATRSRGERLRDLMIEIWNIPRALMATADLSAPLRQGILPTIANPIMATRAFKEMLKQWNSGERADRWLADLKDSPGYQLMEKSGLYIADKTNPSITAKEEDFQTNLAEKMPIFGKGFKLSDAGVLEGTKVGDIKWGEFNVGGKKIGNVELIGRSERAYVSYLNKMRADLFTRGVDVLQNQGISHASNPKAYEALSTYINASTGRGNLGALERAAPVLNAVFFSPRLMASRIQLLTNFANPRFYQNTPKSVRNMYFRDMAKFISFGLGILALASMGGADVEDDPRSPDFGKIKKGNTRWDIWGGFQQFVRYFSQIALGEKKSSASGKITPLDGTGYNKDTRLTTLMDLGRSKLAPVPAFIINYLAGGNMVGDKFNATKDLQNMAYPLVWQGIYDSYKQDGALFAVGATGVPSMLGVGVQTYGVNDFLTQGVDDKTINLLKSKKAVAIEPREGDKKIYDVKTGEEREMTDAEFKKYYATWVDGIKQGVNKDYESLSKLTPAEFEKEFRSIKARASKQAKEAVVGFPMELKTYHEGDEVYELNTKQIKLRNKYYQEFLKDNKDSYDSEADLKKDARGYSKDMLQSEGYGVDAEGELKINKKQ